VILSFSDNAFARKSNWEAHLTNGSFPPSPTIPNGCVSCHTSANPSGSALQIADKNIDFDATGLTINLADVSNGANLTNAPNPISYSWRYRIDPSSGSTTTSSFLSEGSRFIDVPSGAQSAEVDYCIGEIVSNTSFTFGTTVFPNGRRNMRCSSFTITRNPPPNEAPVITTVRPSGTLNVDLGDSISITVTATDDGPSAELRHFASSNNAVVSVPSSGGSGSSVSYSISAESVGTAVVSFTVDDRNGIGGLTSAVSTVTINVTDPVDDDPPNISFDPTSLQVTVPTLAIGTIPNPGLLDPVIVAPCVLNDCPTIDPPDPNAKRVVVTITDEDPESLSIEVTPTAGILISTVGNEVGATSVVQTYDITGMIVGSAGLKVVATDDAGQQSSETLPVNVVDAIGSTPVSPTVTVTPGGDQIFTQIEQTQMIRVNVSDDNLPGITYSIAQQGGDVASVRLVSESADNSFADYEIKALAEGNTEIWISVEDSDGNFETAIIPVRVDVETVPVDNAPSISVPNNSIRVSVGATDIMPVSINDEEPAGVSLITTSDNEGIAITEVNAANELIISGRGAGTTTVSLFATDSGGQNSETVLIDVTVEQDNQAPTAQTDTYIFTFQSDSQDLEVTENDSDPENGALTILLSDSNSTLGGVLAVNGSFVNYTPPENWTQADSFFYRVQDDGGLTSNEVIVNVTASDNDGDGIFDNADNCLSLSNFDQADMDSDGTGDVCDIDPDGDGTIGITGEVIASGQALVEEKCLLCHLEGLAGAPVFGDQDAWDARLAATGVEGLVESVLNGLGAMPAFGDELTALEATQAVRYLAGLEDDVVDPIPNPELTDLDGDSIFDDVDNCLTVANSDQADADGNGVGDVCEPLADNDGDGYPRSLDDDDSNAKRLLSSSNTDRPSIFSSASDMSLGALARNAAEAKSFSSAGIELTDSEFTNAAEALFPGVTVETDTAIIASMGVIDLLFPMGNGDAIIQLAASLPLNPELRVYDTATGSWRNFNTNGSDQLFSAPLVGNNCPASTSSNYLPGLGAGLECVRFTLNDGGANDADQGTNGQTSLVARLGRSRPGEDGGTGPDVIDTNPSKGGGGAMSMLLPLLLLLRLLAFGSCRAKLRVTQV